MSSTSTQPFSEDTFAHHLGQILTDHWQQPVELALCKLLTAGASAMTWRVVVDRGQRQEELIVKLDSTVDPFSFQIGKHAEASVQHYAWQAGVPTPEVIAEIDGHPVLGSGYVMSSLPGQSLGNRILKDPALASAREQLVFDCARTLAQLHGLPRSGHLTALPSLDARAQLDQLYALHREYADPLPVFALTHRWLQDHQPEPLPLALVHGDFRLGNLLVNEQGLSGVLDWELAHWGDPREDLGWLCVRAWRFHKPQLRVGGFADSATLLEAYRAASGTNVSDADLRYWQLLGTFKWGVICQYQAHRHQGDQLSLEHAAIGRRVAETEYDLLVLLEEIHQAAQPFRAR